MKQFKKTPTKHISAGAQTTYSISDLYASAYDTAIEETAKYVNKITKKNYDYSDWCLLEPFAIVNELMFDENGYIR